MNFIACDGTWEIIDNRPSCTGTLVSVSRDQLIPSGISAEDHAYLREQSIGLFAIVFGALVLKKVLTTK